MNQNKDLKKIEAIKTIVDSLVPKSLNYDEAYKTARSTIKVQNRSLLAKKENKNRFF